MKTIQTELQKIADAIKGAESEESVKTTQDLLAEIRDNIAGTTPSGEVKNMQVLLGEIAQAISDNPPSPEPSEPFEVTGSFDGSSVEPTVTVDKTLSESLQAYAAGKNVVFKITDTSDSRLYTTFAAMPILNSTGTENDSMFGAYAIFPDPQSHKLAILGFYYTGDSTLGYITFSET